ncbi:unnamed protein product [Clavelina lepadiformis]|uniref:EGF domain-specific O-linked N-acetylglucosamine transferase n=1 Tax=Clavelina lepadiformis TaxID=159417 RepID=A0ABP0F744_CLALP
MQTLPFLSFLLSHMFSADCYDWSSLKLMRSHVPYVFSHHPHLKQLCAGDEECPYKEYSDVGKACWGFEPDCKRHFGNEFPTLDCPSERSKTRYWRQGDFGYVEDRLNEMKSRQLCEPMHQQKASLRCTKDSTMCRARNLYVDLRKANERIRSREKLVLEKGEIGGFCNLKENALTTETKVKRDLSAWGEQLAPYVGLDFDPFENPEKHCDVTMDKPVIFVQLDFGGNLYHHFCDFFNLYLTQLANNSWFGTNVQIVRWDMTFRYGELFGSSWKAFTDYDHVSMREYQGKRLCIPDATFAFLPRMAFGLFYSTPLEERCRGTGLFRAFTEHFLYRMGIVDEFNVPTSLPSSSPPRIKVTFLDRGASDRYKVFRRALNQDELIAAMEEIPDFDVQLVKYDRRMSFEDQLSVTRNTDIFIGMHGAGLAHFLFLPDWAVAFELYNCGDIRCYRDLPRLRRLRYLTWEDASKVKEHDKNQHREYGDHAKFWNFTFDVKEFVRLVKIARSWILEHPRFQHLRGNRDEL